MSSTLDYLERDEDFVKAEESCASAAEEKTLLVQRLYARTSNFVEHLKTVESDKKDACIAGYLEFCYLNSEGVGKTSLESVFPKNPIEITFDKKDYESINFENLPNMKKESSRNLIIIEFFTHCCINCIHSIEDIRQIYENIGCALTEPQKFGLKIVSIHSPKFTREKTSESIRAFINRMQMTYTHVINDPECLLWNQLGICCWPTIMIFGPSKEESDPNLLFVFMGEGHKESLRLLLFASFNYFNDKFSKYLPLRGEDESKMESTLRESSPPTAAAILKYPGKIANCNKLLAVSDSGHNRVIVFDKNGLIKHMLGGPQRGFVDGTFSEAKFSNPQGLSFHDEHTLFLADTGNHSIRKIDLNSLKVSTVVSPDWSGLLEGEVVTLKSPWDLVFYSNSVLLVAAAGNHRIFGYFLEKSTLFNKQYDPDSFNVVAGSGKEENRNNSYVLKASFAQPSGICVVEGENENEKIIVIADSESSSLRCISAKGAVSALVGAARDPTDLFAYGDVDGKGVNAKLQHPMGVCFSKRKRLLYAADTYNHKIKMIEMTSKDCSTLIGDDYSGSKNGEFYHTSNTNLRSQLNEPGGVCIDNEEDVLYIADTNNHTVRKACLNEGSVKEVHLTLNKDAKFREISFTKSFNIQPGDNVQELEVEFCILGLPNNVEGIQWNLKPLESLAEKYQKGEMKTDPDNNYLAKCIFSLAELSAAQQQFVLEILVFLCGKFSCYKKVLRFLINCSNNNINDRLNEKKYYLEYIVDVELFKE